MVSSIVTMSQTNLKLKIVRPLAVITRLAVTMAGVTTVRRANFIEATRLHNFVRASIRAASNSLYTLNNPTRQFTQWTTRSLKPMQYNQLSERKEHQLKRTLVVVAKLRKIVAAEIIPTLISIKHSIYMKFSACYFFERNMSLT